MSGKSLLPLLEESLTDNQLRKGGREGKGVT